MCRNYRHGMIWRVIGCNTIIISAPIQVIDANGHYVDITANTVNALRNIVEQISLTDPEIVAKISYR